MKERNLDGLLAELVAIEQWDRAYFMNAEHERLEQDAYGRRQERRWEIITEALLCLRPGSISNRLRRMSMTSTLLGAPTRMCALVVSNEPATVEQLINTLQRLDTSTDVCTDVSSALRLLNLRKFELVVVDLDIGRDAQELVKWLRLSQFHSTTVLFAIVGSKDQSAVAFEAGSNFVLPRPLSSDSINRTFNAAYGLMFRERRRYFRCPVLLAVLVQREGAQEYTHCQGVNLSEDGMCIITALDLARETQVSTRFALPGEAAELTTRCVVLWCNQGRAGLQFVELPSEQKPRLKDWLGRKLEDILTDSRGDTFRDQIESATDGQLRRELPLGISTQSESST